MRLFQPDQEFIVLYRFDGQEKSGQLNCWAEEPGLNEFSAKSRLGYMGGLDESEHNRIEVLSIVEILPSIAG